MMALNIEKYNYKTKTSFKVGFIILIYLSDLYYLYFGKSSD